MESSENLESSWRNFLKIQDLLKTSRRFEDFLEKQRRIKDFLKNGRRFKDFLKNWKRFNDFLKNQRKFEDFLKKRGLEDFLFFFGIPHNLLFVKETPFDPKLSIKLLKNGVFIFVRRTKGHTWDYPLKWSNLQTLSIIASFEEICVYISLPLPVGKLYLLSLP